jgi:Holliday junction resolvase-like predicted endonuclease
MAMTYGEFGKVVDTQDNSNVLKLLEDNCVLEMDGLSANTDKVMFSESLALYLYRYRLSQGPKDKLTNLMVIEEAHNLLHSKQPGSRESVLENSIRMVRQYGLGYVFVDQSASLLSKVAFANSYATLALSQKLKSDITALTSAMNLNDDQKTALTRLNRGDAVVRIADCCNKAFKIHVPLFNIKEGKITDDMLKSSPQSDSANSGQKSIYSARSGKVSDNPGNDKRDRIMQILDEMTSANSNPPANTENPEDPVNNPHPPSIVMTRDSIRFLNDIAQYPLSSTVKRYNRLRLSRRRGNAVKKQLISAEVINAVRIPTRTGQVVLLEIREKAIPFCDEHGIFPARLRESTEHLFWKIKARDYFEDIGYQVTAEYSVKSNGTVDLIAENPEQKIAVEIETGKSDIAGNITKLKNTDFDKLVLVATQPAAVDQIDKALARIDGNPLVIERLCWLDIS